MRKKILHIAACASFLLFLAIVLAWGRSYWRHDTWVMNTSGTQQVHHSKRGYLVSSWVRAHDAAGSPMLEDRAWNWKGQPAGTGSPIPHGSAPLHRVLGLGWKPVNVSGTSPAGTVGSTTGQTWWVAYRLLAACFAVLPAIMIYKHLRITWESRMRLARHGKGLCERCGYDARATTGRCPECGTVASRGTTTAT